MVTDPKFIFLGENIRSHNRLGRKVIETTPFIQDLNCSEESSSEDEILQAEGQFTHVVPLGRLSTVNFTCNPYAKEPILTKREKKSMTENVQPFKSEDRHISQSPMLTPNMLGTYILALAKKKVEQIKNRYKVNEFCYSSFPIMYFSPDRFKPPEYLGYVEGLEKDLANLELLQVIIFMIRSEQKEKPKNTRKS